MTSVTGCLLALALIAVSESAASPENPVFVQLTTEGVGRGSDDAVKLPAPEVPDGLDAAAVRAAIQRIAGPTRRVDDLLRDSVVAPFVMRMGEAEPAPGRPPMRTLDVWFIAHGDFDKLDSEEALRQFGNRLAGESRGDLAEAAGVLDAKQLQARGLSVDDTDDRRERFIHAATPLFDRVLVRATQRVVVTRTDESVLVAGAIDPRFTGDADFPNEWRPLTRLPSGEFEQGDAQPYASAGFYAKLTRLKEPAGAMLVEYRQVYDEPEGWFGGTGLLRSKLPMAVQDGVRRFRRNLRSLGE